jgi:Secretion system C-terminal sorting domain
MKKFLLLPLLILFCNVSSAQIIFEETFDGISGSTAGGAGTYSFPSGWFLRNVDNGTPAANVAYVNDAWERREDFANNVADSCAFSTSWYSPAGTANDWMWTPAITLTNNCELSWNAVTYDADYPDGYEVRIMTSGPPTGGSGVIGNQISNSTVLFSTVAENTSWTSRSVSLTAYNGQTVYIGFRNNSNDKFLLLIDDIKVEQLNPYEAGVSTATPWSVYSIIPLNQQPSFTLSADVDNNGSQAVTGVVLTADVYDLATNNVYNSSSTPLGSLAAGSSSNLTTTGTFTPSAEDFYDVYYSVTINEADSDPGNDTLYGGSILISDSVMAKDDGIITSTLGIGAGVTGYLGNSFEVTQTAVLSSASVFLNAQPANSSVGIAIFDIVAGVPTNLLYASPTLVLPTDTTDLLTFEVSPGNPLILNPGSYLVAAVETDSTLAIGTTDNIFTTGTCWVDWTGNPLGGWANVEAFGAAFAKTFVIRANLQDVCAGFTVTASANDTEICAGDTVVLTASGGDTYSWDNGGSGSSIQVNPGSTSDFTVIGTNTAGCSDTAIVSITVNPLPNINITAPQLSSNECEGSLDTLQASGASSYLWDGGISGSSLIITHAFGVTSWTVTGTDGNGCSSSETITINNVNTAPTVTANATSNSICAGDNVTLTGGGANSYTWDNTVLDGIPFSPSGTATYTVTGTDAFGCSNTAQTTVTVNALPNVTANASGDSLCTGDLLTLTGGGASTYTWDNSVTNGTPFVPSGTQTYTVTGTDNNNCTNTASVTVVVSSCIGLEDINSTAILNVYPNPSTGIFQLQVKEEVQIAVYSVEGRLIQQMQLIPGNHLLNLEKEATGIYLLQINTSNGQYRMKLTKE